jgi:hypothetical protein
MGIVGVIDVFDRFGTIAAGGTPLNAQDEVDLSPRH